MPTTPPLEAAVARYHDPLVRFATRIVGDRERARDVVQDTFVRLCEAGDEVDSERLGAWLYTVCRNRAVDVRRREARLVHVVPDVAPDVHDDGLDEVWEKIGGLDDVKRRVLLLRYQAGHSYKRISQLTGLSVSNVGFVLHATVRALKKELVAAAVLLSMVLWWSGHHEEPLEARATAEHITVPTLNGVTNGLEREKVAETVALSPQVKPAAPTKAHGFAPPPASKRSHMHAAPPTEPANAYAE